FSLVSGCRRESESSACGIRLVQQSYVCATSRSSLTVPLEMVNSYLPVPTSTLKALSSPSPEGYRSSTSATGLPTPTPSGVTAFTAVHATTPCSAETVTFFTAASPSTSG